MQNSIDKYAVQCYYNVNLKERRLTPMDTAKETFFQYVSGMADEGSHRISLRDIR